MNSLRLIWGGLYGFLGIILLIIFLVLKRPDFDKFFSTYSFNILWCVGWSTIGIATGLWNSLNDSTSATRKNSHYITYFLFVLFIASLAAFVVFLSIANSHLAYVSSALLSIVAGFTGDKLAGDILKLRN